jgi:hypothetical protein
MADHNNDLVGKLSPAPNPALQKLDRLVGTWTEAGPVSSGTATFDWLEGGFFMTQSFDFNHGGRSIKGIEYIGFDEDTQTLRSHLMDNWGDNFVYTWDIVGDALTISFGGKDSDNYFSGTFSADGNSYAGRWRWPEAEGSVGGYELTSTRSVR